LNWIDRAVAYIAPIAGAKRAYARAGLQLYAKNEARIRAFDAAKRGRRTSGWKTSGTSANADTELTLNILRSRSRDLVANNVWAKRAVNVISSNTIGEGIIPQIVGRNDNQTALIDQLFKEWGDTPACDAAERHDFYGIQALVNRGVTTNGEALVRRRWRRRSDGLPVPTQLQVLEADFIDTSKTQQESGGFFSVQGIRFNPLGRRVGYWLFDEHPGGNVTGRGYSVTSKLVDAKDIIHVFRMDRAGQVRGVPWGAACLLRLRDFDELEDAVLMRQKIANMFTVFISSPDSSSVPNFGNVAQEKAATEMEPGMIEYLTGNKSVSFAAPPAAEGFKDYSQLGLRAISTGFDVSYEALTGDLGNVNFSSGRMGWVEFYRQIKQWRSELYIPHLCHGVFNWFLEAAALDGRDIAGVRRSFTPPRREYIDPTKEVPAEIEAVRAGIKTPSEVVREQGRDFEEHLLEYKADLESMDKHGLKLEFDPRVSKSAAAAASAPAVEGKKKEAQNESA
jgi:lambda family phage portal protein